MPLQSLSFSALMPSADVRGNNNRVITHKLGKIGNLLIVEADNFFGETDTEVPGWGLDDSVIEMSGLRQYSGADPTTAPWTGQSTFDYAGATLHSRGIILGAGAIQCAFGKMPDYSSRHLKTLVLSQSLLLSSGWKVGRLTLSLKTKTMLQLKSQVWTLVSWLLTWRYSNHGT